VCYFRHKKVVKNVLSNFYSFRKKIYYTIYTIFLNKIKSGFFYVNLKRNRYLIGDQVIDLSKVHLSKNCIGNKNNVFYIA